MRGLDWLVGRQRLVLTVALLLSLTGAVAWMTMGRQEDPRLSEYWGQVTVVFPGADAEMVERLVVEPLEDALAEVEQIHHTEATAYAEFAVIFVELAEGTREFREAWDDVRTALDHGAAGLPEGVSAPVLNDELSGEQESIVYAITGSTDELVLRAAARRLKDELLTVAEVSRVHLAADPGEQVTIALDGATARQMGMSAAQVAAQLSARSQVISGGSLAVSGRTVRLRPLSDFGSVDEIAATPILLPGGGALPLGQLARVHQGPAEPAAARMRHNGEIAIGLGVVPKPDANIVDFGNAVRRAVERAGPSLAPLSLHEVVFQPARVSDRLAQLGGSLLQGIAIVAGIVILAMGLRLGLLVASIVPLVAMASLGIYALAGGVLHQISIAALVLSLGMLVDNAIVVGENIQWRIDRGQARAGASRGAVRELAVPLAGATATTLAAFVPMLISRGVTAEFTRSIPIVVMLTLTVSYVYALLVTPALAAHVLRPGAGAAGSRSARLAGRLSTVALARPGRVVAIALLAVMVSLAGAGLVRQQFFPSSDRNQIVIDLKLDEGSHLDATDDAARRVERALLERPEVASVTSFLGRSAPHFYYNLPRVPWSPHFAQIVVDTHELKEIDPLIAWTRQFTAERLVGVEVIPRRLEQGPPVGAPVEVRLTGGSLEELYQAALAVAAVLRETPGAVDVRHSLGPGEPTLRLTVDDAAAARHGVSRAEVAQALYGRTRGVPVGDLRTGDDPIPIVVRDPAGERLQPEDVPAVDVCAPDGRLVPLAQVTRVETTWRPAAIQHRSRERVVVVSSQLAAGVAFSDVIRRLEPRIRELAIPDGVELRFGGDLEGSGEANSSLLAALPIGLMLLLGVLLAEFNSFRRLAIILTTVPLAAAGVIPGLLAGNQPFGFTSMLGVIALIGIVVNNAIILLEVIESRRREGAGLDESIREAVAQRLRPILLTTGTTVAGLLPLALSPSTLWPPLAWAMISGLISSTLLTLVVVPALYRLVFAREEPAAPDRRAARSLWAALTRRRGPSAAAGLLLALVAGSTPVRADEATILSLPQALERGRSRPAAEAARQGVRAAEEVARAERRAAYLPVIGLAAARGEKDRDLALVTPAGSFAFGNRRSTTAGARVTQPLIDLSRQVYGARAAGAEREAAWRSSERSIDELAMEAGEAWIDSREIEARSRVAEAYVTSLEGRLEEMLARVEEGRVLQADALKVDLALAQARQDLLALREGRTVAAQALARAAGLEGDARVSDPPDWLSVEPPLEDEAMRRAWSSRADLAALEAVGRAQSYRRDAVRAELLPRLQAEGTWSWTEGSAYDEDQWLEGTLAVSWTPFAAGTTGPRSAVHEAQRRAVREEWEEARRGVAVEVGAALAGLRTARAAHAVAERGVLQANETLRVERERHRAGRATTNDLLEAEATVRDQEVKLEVARLTVLRAWLALWLAGGVGVLPGS